MAGRYWIRVIVTSVVYSIAIGLGGYVFVPNTAPVLLAVPFVSGCLLLLHAIQTTNLDELGFAIVGMWTAILALSVAIGVLDELFRSQAVDLTTALGTVGITIVLVAGYLVAVNR
ncbi:hypothetical protein [Natrinema marinum]|uniref:hypothetical protein n=1 Tax=Natrinema marinum TaxID=2961598 RepID=UPI0020C8E428|nr:hypothetical protein [Natrinema marinum]